jgi:hypothetical protein
VRLQLTDGYYLHFNFFAKRNIKIGEELTADYSTYSEEYPYKIL